MRREISTVSILVIALLLFCPSKENHGTSYEKVKTEIETFLEGEKRYFKFSPKGIAIPHGKWSISFSFNIYENKEPKKKMWEFNSFSGCSESSETGVVEYAKIRNKYCFVDYCNVKDSIDLYGSKRKCLDKILFNPIPLESGVEYLIELKSPHEGRLIFVH